MKSVFSRKEMTKLNISALKRRGIKPTDIALIAFNQLNKYNNTQVSYDKCLESVYKVLSLRDIFHIVLVGLELDDLANKGLLSEPVLSIIKSDLATFGLDEIFGINIAGLYGVIGETNFGDIDVNKPDYIRSLSASSECTTFLDDIVAAIAAAASTRVAQIMTENKVLTGLDELDTITIFDFEKMENG